MDSRNEDLPYDIRMVTPGTPEYELAEAEDAAFQRNLDYFNEHAEEIIERYPGPSAIVVYNGGNVRSFVRSDELTSFLGTLSDFERASALIEEQPDPNVIVIPTAVWVP